MRHPLTWLCVCRLDIDADQDARCSTSWLCNWGMIGSQTLQPSNCQLLAGTTMESQTLQPSKCQLLGGMTMESQQHLNEVSTCRRFETAVVEFFGRMWPVPNHTACPGVSPLKTLEVAVRDNCGSYHSIALDGFTSAI